MAPPHEQLDHLHCSGKSRHQEPLSRPQGQLYLLLLRPSDRKIRWPRTGVQLSPRRQASLQPLLNTVLPRQPPRHHLTLLTLTVLAVLGCFKKRIFLPRQPALSVVTTHGPLRLSFFCPDGALPVFVTGIPALSNGPELWYAVHNHRPETLQLHAGQSISVLEVVHLTEAPASASPSSHPTQKPCQPPLPECLSPLQQQQLNELFKEFQDVFSQSDDDLGNTPLLEHGIETHGPPLCQPYRR